MQCVAGCERRKLQVGRVFTSYFWGTYADKHGRRRVLFIGCATLVPFSLLFGVAQNFWMAVAVRYMLAMSSEHMMHICNEQ